MDMFSSAIVAKLPNNYFYDSLCCFPELQLDVHKGCNVQEQCSYLWIENII